MEIPRHSTVFRSIAWVVVFTQLFAGSAFADIKSFSKATLAPQYLSQSNPPDKNAAQETKLIIGITSVLDYIGRRHFVDRRPIETIQRDTRDQFRNTPSWLDAIEFKSLKMDGDALTLLYKDPEDEKSHQARISPRDHGASEDFGIKLRAERPEKGFDRDLRGKDSEPSNDKIIELIKSGNIIEVSYSESAERLFAHRVKFIEKYDELRANPSAYLVNLKDPVPMEQIVNSEQAAAIMNWLRTHKAPKDDNNPERYIKFRIALGNSVLHWAGNADSSNMLHAGKRDAVIYLGHDFLKYIFQPGNEEHVKDVLDKDEYMHILKPEFKHTKKLSKEYLDRIAELEDLARRGMITEGVSHRTFWGFRNEIGLDLIDEVKDKKERRSLMGTTDLEILEIDPSRVDVRLALSDEIDFMPNRFNRWDGIVRSANVAKVVVPQGRFRTKPLRGVVREEIAVPSDEVSDSYSAMRQSIYAPVIKDHLENLDLDINDLTNDPSFIGYVGNGNLLMNQAIVAWKNKVLYMLNGESLERDYPCLVRFKNGKMAIRRLRFIQAKDYPHILDIDNNSKDITDEVIFASSGISVLRGGADSPVVNFIKTGGKEPGAGADNELWQDYDIRHYASLPFLGSELGAFGMSQMYPKGGADKDLIARTVARLPVELKYEDAYLPKLLETLARMGYDDAKSPNDIPRFKYFLNKKNSTVTLRIEPALYPHNICVETEDGKIVFIIARGRSSNKGMAIADIPRMLKSIGIRAKNAVVFDNGGDAIMNFKGVNVAPSFIQPPREWIMSMFVFKRNNAPAQTGRKKRVHVAKDEFGKAHDRVRFFRSLYRYVERRKDVREKDYSQDVIQTERFILGNSEFIASQLEKALDSLDSYIALRADVNFTKPEEDSTQDEKDKYEKEKRGYAAALRWKLNSILAGAILHEEDVRELLKGAKNIADYDAMLRDIVSKLIYASGQNSTGLELEESDLKILPEIWRIRFASYFVTFFNGREDPEYTHLELSDANEYIERLAKEHKVGALFDMLLAFRRLDKSVRYGDKLIDEIARKTFRILETRTNTEEVSVVPVRGVNDSSTIIKKSLFALKDGSLRKGTPNRIITLAKQRQIDLSQMVIDAKTFDDLDGETDKERVWKQADSSPNYRNDWIEIAPSAKIIYASEKVVAYLNRIGNIELVVRGNDLKRVGEGKDISRMSVILDQMTNKVIALNISEDNLPLSRTTLAIQLNDSGIFDKYPSLKDVLETNLVWEEPSAEAREKDIIDLSQIDYALIQRAMKDPAGITKPEDVLKLMDFKYCKAKVIRQYALEALMRIYDTGHPFFTMTAQDGPKKGQVVMDDEKMKMVIIDFLFQDIEEDFRIIERAIKNDKPFVASICKGVFGVKEPVDLERDIALISVEFLRHESGRSVYKAIFDFSKAADVPEGFRGRSKVAFLSFTRHDDISDSGVTNKELEGASINWINLVKSGIKNMIQRPAVRYWALDYRVKELKLLNDEGEEIIRRFNNHICVQANEFIPDGVTLKDVLGGSAYRAAEKREAVRAAAESAIQLYEEAKSALSIGYYIKHPNLEDFVLTRNANSDERWHATIINMNQLAECDSEMKTLRASFSKFPYQDVIDETFALHIGPDLQSDILKLIVSGNMIEMAGDDGVLKAHNLKYSEERSGYPSTAHVVLSDKIDVDKLFTPREQNLVLEWMETRSFNGRQIRFRVAMDKNNIGLGWETPGEHAAVAANEFSDGCVYISYLLLKEILLKERVALRESILDEDILGHIKGGAFKPQEDRTEYKIIRGVVDSLKKKASQETDNRNFDIDKAALTKAIAAVKDAETLVFDVDRTIALHRAGQIESSIAEILYKVMTQKNGPKNLRIVTGRSFEELNDTEFFAPLLGLFRKTNEPYNIEVYVSEGADRYVVRKGELEKVSGYSKPFTKVEADIIMQVLEESHRKIDREEKLSNRGIDKRITNEGNVKFSYSPYGREPSEYDFESDLNEKTNIPQNFPKRKTRDKLISELVEEINRRGIEDIAGRKGGVSTIGFVRKGVCKKEAIKHILESQKGAKVVYFGDEFGNLPGQFAGNDSVVVDPDIVDNYPEFRVVALNDRKEGIYMPKPSRDVMFWVGGFYRGTQEVLKGAYDIILAENPDEIAAVADAKDMLSRFYGIEESSIERIYRFEKGKGTHERYFKIDTKDKKSYRLVYSNEELFADTLDAARYEVWLINTLAAANPRIPVVPIVEKKRLWMERDKDWETDKDTDGYISKGRNGRYYILYEYMDGDGIAPAPADISGDDPRFRALVENGARMHTVLLGIKKEREAKGLTPYPYSRIYVRSGSGIRGPEGDSIIDVADFTAGLDAVCVSAKKKASASNPKLAQAKHFILEHSEFIKEQIALMKKNLRDLYPKLRRLPIHGDWAPHNFLFKDNRVVGMVDWEHSREEAMVFDLVGAIRAGEVNADGRETGRFNLQDMRTLITTYVEAFDRLNPEDRLRKEEIEALPEIFRCRMLYRLSRIANPDRYYEARGFKFPTGTKNEEKAAILMASDDELFKWHVELVTALFNLDEMIRSGNIYGKVVEPLINTISDSTAETAPIKKTVRKPSAILEECLEQVRLDPKQFSISFKPLSGVSLARLMANPKSVFELVKAKKYRWTKDGYMYTNGWAKLETNDKVFYERKNVVIYQKLDGILYVVLRGHGDRTLKANIGRDQARIKIAVDSRGNIKSMIRDNVGEYDLSRSGIALELKDSGVFNDFPELGKALKYQLVWQDIKTDLRVRELRDASVVNLVLVKKAMEDPDKLNDAEISQIEEFVYLKSKILRRMGLDALSRIYEAHRIGEDEFREWVVKFIDNDIKEDYRIIERGLKNNRQFVIDIFRNLLGYENESAPIDDIVKAEITYTGQDKEKDTFKVQFSIKKKGGGTRRLGPIALSLIRYEEPAIGRMTLPRPERIPAKMDIESLRQSIELWSKMSDKGISQIAKFGGEFIEWDYRAKTVQLTEGKKKGEARFENNIQVIARQYALDRTLGEVLKDPALSASEKIAAIEACRICSREFYETTKKIFGGRGYFIENPIPREFAVTRRPGGKYSAMIIGLERVADFPNLKMVEELFDRHMPSPSSIIKPPVSAAGDQVPLSLSILYADQAGLRDEVKKAMKSGIDSVHIDHFDGTLTTGDIIDCADSIRKISDIGMPIFTHLWTKKLDRSMVYKLIKDGLKPHRDRIVIPYEAFDSATELVLMIEYIKSKGLEVGISINPETPITVLDDIWQHFDDTMNTVTVMCVKPGGGGRAVEPGSFHKVRALKEYIRQRGSSVMIEIDGGITPETYENFFKAGADSLGARSIFIKAPDMRKRVDEIKLQARSIMREGASKFTELVDKIRAEGKDIGGLSFLAICPMSADIIKAYIEVARDTGLIPTFIATPRQVDVEGSYTGWSQKAFMRILRKTADETGYAGPIFVERDHGGPWQRPQDIDLSLSRAMANAKRTYYTDMEEGFDILHIDVTLDPMTERGPPIDKMVERTIELIADCEAHRVLKGIDPIAYEIGCDEPGSGLTSPEEVESYLKALFAALELKDLDYVKKNIIFLVVNTGTNLQGAHQTGRLDLDRVAKFSVIAKHYGLGLKQHYTDYLDNKQLEMIPASGILGVNVGPEFSKIEYEALADLESQVLARIQNSDTNTFVEAVKAALDKTDRWRRWFPNVISISRASAEQQREIVLSCGRYVQEDEQVRSAKQILYARARIAKIDDPEKWVIDRIKKSILRYDDAFKVKSASRKTSESLGLTVVEPEKFSKISVDPEPLIGHGFTAEQLSGIRPLRSEEFNRVMDDLEAIVDKRSPSSLRDRLLTGIKEFKSGANNNKEMGVINSLYDDTQKYYLGFGIKNAIGLGREFFDPKDPLNAFAREALLHELYQAVMSSGSVDEDIEGESTIHYTALRLQAMLFWDLNDVEQAAIQWMTPLELENHPKNLLKRAIVDWKKRHSPIPEEMWKDDWKPILIKLKDALKHPERSYKKLADFLIVCNDASVAGFRHKYPVESRYPLLRAVTLLDDKERDLLVSVLKSNPKIKRLAISDTILLMLGKGDFENWLEEQAPELVGRNIYQASSEIWYPGGGLGRVMQYHGEAEYKLLGPYSSQLRQIEPGYHWRRNATGDWTPMDYRSTEVMANPIVTELEEVERFPVVIGDRVTEAIVKRGKNDLGITVYLISDKDGFFTHSLYNYNDDGTNPQLPTWEQFTEFMCRASLELYRRQEEKEMVVKGGAWKAPIFHGNDAQFSLVWIYAMFATYQENGVTKRYADNPVIKATIKAFTTHTYFNREARSGKDGQARLRTLHIPEQYWEKYFKSNRGSNWEEVYDLTSAGLRTADWTGAVARKHMNDVRIYDEWTGLDLRAVTNGDSRARTSSAFRSILSDRSIFPGETVDLEHPTPAQILKAKREAKRRVSLRPGQFYTSKPEADSSILNPDQKVVIYTGRLAPEKVGRRRAFCDENIEALVKEGKQVVIYANVQNYPESRKLAEELKELVEHLKRQGYMGKLVFAPRFTLADQRALFAAANVGVVDSDPHTEAAGFSETNFASCGALVVAPPWPDGEGILVAQGIKLNFDIEGEGNTLIPDVVVTEDDIKNGLVNNDTPLRAKIRAAYLAVMKRALDMPEEKFAKYMETSYRLSRVLEALPTGAEYLRQFNQTVAGKNAVTAQAASNPAALTQTKDLKGASAPESNPLISKLIAEGKMVEISLEESGLKAYAVNYVNGYEPGVTDPNKYRGPPVEASKIFNTEEAATFKRYIEEHPANGKAVKFRIVLGESAIGWKDDVEHSNIAHAGERDGVVYIGEKLLRRLMQRSADRIRKSILDDDELEHLNGRGHGTDEDYRARLELVKELLKNVEARESFTRVTLPDFGSVSLADLVRNAPTIEEYAASKGVNPLSDPQYRLHYYLGSAVGIVVKEDAADEYRIIKHENVYDPLGKYEGTIFVYYHNREGEADLVKKDNAITIVMEGAMAKQPIFKKYSDIDRGEKQWDRAVIKIYLDENHDRISMIDHKVRDKNGLIIEMGLSRSMIDMILLDSRFNTEYPVLYNTLSSFLILPAITYEARDRERLDNVPVSAGVVKSLMRKARGEGAAGITERGIKMLERFMYYKSLVLRQLAINILTDVAERGKIRFERLDRNIVISETEHIEEDLLFIQRQMIDDPGLVTEAFYSKTGIRISRAAIAAIDISWVNKGVNKNVFMATCRLKSGISERFAIALIRQNPIGFGYSEAEIENVMNGWNVLAVAHSSVVPKIYAQRWIRDFRPRLVRSRGGYDTSYLNDIEMVKNDIHILFREFVEGDDLEVELQKELSSDYRRSAVFSVLQAYLELWNATYEEGKGGLFIDDPKPANAVVKREADGYAAKAIDLDSLRVFEKFDEMVRAIRSYPEYNGFDIILKDGKAVVMKKPGRPVNISISLGGTKVGAGVVSAEGEVKATAKNILWREVYGDGATADNIDEAILRQVVSFVDNGDVGAEYINGVGIAFAGPIDEDTGIVGTPFKAPNLPFDHYPLKAKLEILLKARFDREITVKMYNDSKAALLGEMSPKGLLSGKPSGGIMILGTGVNITVARDGQAYFGAKNEIRELGHNLVAKADADGVWHYRYTGLETLGDHPKFVPGEMDFEDRNGGSNLDRRFKEASGGKFGIKEITQAAMNRDVLAVELIKQTGEEIGRGIAAFQYAYRREPFIYNLVLVSSVSENLGKGVMNEDGNDLFMSAVQGAASKELIDMGMTAAEAEKAGRGIVRSAMTYERELVAFTPRTADTSSAGVLRDMEAIHGINMDPRLLPAVDPGKVLYHVIAEELIPGTMIGHMQKLARETEDLKMRERIKIVKRKDMKDMTAGLCAEPQNIVLAAVQCKEDLVLLPRDVKALVFTGDDGGAYGFRQIEGIWAALRALYRSDTGTLARLYKMLTGTPFTGKEGDILKYINDPEALAGIITFNLEPAVAKDGEELQHLNNRLLEFLYKA